MDLPPYLQPFVLSEPSANRERHGRVDLYLPELAQPRPAVVFVHGGPIPAALTPTPRDWPSYTGYGNAVAARGFVGVTVDHRLHDHAAYPRAAQDVRAAVEFARQDRRVDGERVALWFFSGGGLLLADWLRGPPAWLHCFGATYPLCAPLPDWTVDPRFRPIEAVAGAGTVPIVLTTVGRERPEIAVTVTEFRAAAQRCGARLTVIDVPDGQHGFDQLDHAEQSRIAVRRALDAVLANIS